MKILTSDQVKEVDKYTIENEPVLSIDLMERAAGKCSEWIINHFPVTRTVNIFVGPGNNGGDGLAVARHLAETNSPVYQVKVFLLKISEKLSLDAEENLDRLRQERKVKIFTLRNNDDLPAITPDEIIVDALFGSGLNRPLEGFPAQVIKHLNSLDVTRIAIDIPSGLFGEDNSGNNLEAIFKADHTLTFQIPFLSFFFPEHEQLVGKWHILPIGLHAGKISEMDSSYFLVTKDFIRQHLKTRKRFDHKGSFGHILLIAGGYGKMGAAVLACKAALRTGSGLVTAHIPKLGYDIMQTTVPEVMINLDHSETVFSDVPEFDKYTAIGAGPGLGTEKISEVSLGKLIERETRPMVIDADALNMLSMNQEWLDKLPANCILTPHPKEFERLTKPVKNHFERLQLQKEFSGRYKVFLVLKGGNTTISTPDGKIYFNITGNPGMAAGGSGDVLTGMITSLLGQGYEPEHAAVIGVFIHGLAGDLAVQHTGEEALTASDIIESIGLAFTNIRRNEE